MPDGDIVHTIYVEMKNKHNTMNSASSAKTYIKMQGQILEDDDCACLLVEAIAKKSQNIKWSTKVDGKNVQHRLIRRVSMDQFYAILTGEEDAFYKMCMALPEVINYAVTKKKLKASGVKMEKQASVSEDIGCVVLELGYFIDFFGKGLQDPLSVALSLTREEQEERVKISVNEMLEEYVWSKD